MVNTNMALLNSLRWTIFAIFWGTKFSKTFESNMVLRLCKTYYTVILQGAAVADIILNGTENLATARNTR